ncbi:MAG: phosphoribosylamine--glycine ligase [Flavobacteriales bacterium]|nr:phosphoribosylamine--glycine ligase [Flavobacteriales bacterium]
MNVLVLGSGGREHAIAWKLAQSSQLTGLYIAPGNAGTSQVGINADIKPDDFKAVKKFVLEKNIELVVVGPEQPLVNGIADFFAADKELKKVAVIGPNKKGAQLEGSKHFAKQFMQKYNIPTAKYAAFTKETLVAGQKFLETLKAPYVLKADGLASGKGVLIIPDLKDAKSQLKEILTGEMFGEAGCKVVVEEFLKGVELSLFILTDGLSYKILPSAKDYKRSGDGDTGTNTGGMGAVSPVPFATREFIDKVDNQVVLPTMRGLREEGIIYKGFIFIGIMKVGNEPYVIEYNCRMGDPESEVVIPRIKSDLLSLFEGVATGTLGECDLQVDERTAATVMLVSKGYPGKYDKGKEIKGLEKVERSIVFHAGTKMSKGKVVTNGGRVLAITTLGKGMEDALKWSYKNVELIEYSGKTFRKDIGFDLRKISQKA